MRARVDARTAVKPGGDVSASLVDPIYVRDRAVLPAGATIAGRIEMVRTASGKRRLWALTSGDLTPGETATVRFGELALPDGTRMRIDAVATAAADEVELRPAWWKDYLVGQLPYHRRYLHAGALMTVKLIEPLSFGSADAVPPPRPSSRAAVRLLTPLDSRSSRRGDRVRASLLEPIVAADGRLVAVEGDVVEATVTAVRRARWLGRSGRVAFQVGGATHAEAGAGVSKFRFVWPPLAILALRGARAPDATGTANVLGRSGAGWSGFELIGAAIAETSTPVAIGFGMWGLVRAAWVDVLARGRDVVLPEGSIVLLDEIGDELGVHEHDEPLADHRPDLRDGRP